MVKQVSCPFCTNREPVLKENGTARAFLSNPRKVPGHFLVAPKRHIEKPWELTQTELKDVFSLIFFIEKQLVSKLGQGVDIRQNYRPYIQQDSLKVDHVLFHVYPRYHQDYLYQVSEKFEADLFTELDSAETEEFMRLLNP
ncbi:HIT family protein [Patescibacteria group bacterium]|nr:HIT family protein [Patescibacteria group bacterium]